MVPPLEAPLTRTLHVTPTPLLLEAAPSPRALLPAWDRLPTRQLRIDVGPVVLVVARGRYRPMKNLARLPEPAAPEPPPFVPGQTPLPKLPFRIPNAKKPRTLGAGKLTRVELAEKRRLNGIRRPSHIKRLKLPVLRPLDRDVCPDIRPCPFVSCRKNNYFTETGDGVVKKTYPDLEPHQMDPHWSCSEDAVDRGGATVEEVAYALGMTAERVRQITVTALAKLREGKAAEEMRSAWSAEP